MPNPAETHKIGLDQSIQGQVNKSDQIYYVLLAIQQLNIMYEMHHAEERQNKEVNLYEDLTEFIKIFKTIMKGSQSITSLLVKSEQCTHHLNQLKDLLLDRQKLIAKYNYEIDELSPHKNTYFRFVCRLLENIGVYKNCSSNVHSSFPIFHQFVIRAESVLNSWKLDKNIGKVFKKIFAFTSKFCSSCEIVINNGSHRQAIQSFSKKQIQSENGESHIKKIQFNNSQSNFHKVMGGLTKRYSTMSCLDLDYNSFKGIFFKAKHQKNDLFKQIFQRNNFIYRQITLYSKQFDEYLKRRQKQIVRRNRFREGKSLGNTFSMSFKKNNEYNKSLDVTKIVQTEKQEDDYESNQLEEFSQMADRAQSKLLKIKERDIPEDKLFQFQQRKASYQVKNIYLTLNKIHTHSEINQKQIKNQKKYGKDKGKVFSILKSNKYALKSTKFVDTEFLKVNRPLLDIRHLDFKNMEIKLEENQLLNYPSCNPDAKYQTIQQRKSDFANILEKKNIRINQILKKNSFNFRIKNQTILNGIQNFHITKQEAIQQQFR